MSINALTIIVAALCVVVIALIIALVVVYREQRRTRLSDPSALAVANALRDGEDERAINELLGFLEALSVRVQTLGEDSRTLDEALTQLTHCSRAHLQRIGIVRFDASDSVSGRLSCALAILDAHNDGFLITTLYDLERSRTFVRAIRVGRADRELLEEERAALAMATQGGFSAVTSVQVGETKRA